MICRICRHTNVEGGRFCSRCGHHLAEGLPDPSEGPLSRVDVIGGERRQLSVMFCDVVGSTALSARLDLEELHEVMQAYRAACGEVIARFDGHIAQYLGDGILVYFGYPRAHEDDAPRAVSAALRILEAIRELNDHITPRHGIRLAVRVGIHSGLVVVGGMGAIHGQLALGATPNLAAHLQALAEPGAVLISGTTHRLVHGMFVTRDLGAHTLKGASAPMQVFRVLEEGEARTRLDALAATGLTHLVGRAEEVGLLLDRWQEMTKNHGQSVLLTGEPGIGKSRLVRVLKEQISGTPHVRLECRCSADFEHTPLYPVLDLLPRLCGWTRDDSAETKLAKLEKPLARYGVSLPDTIPLFASLLSLPTSERYPLAPMSAERQKRATLDALSLTVLAIAAESPVLLIVEDLHWADPSTVEFLTLLLEQVRTARILALFTARPSFQVPHVWGSHLTTVTLNRFTAEQTKVMIAHVAGGKTLPGDVLQEIATKTDGIPLFVEELTKMVLESGLLREVDGDYELSGPLPSLAIPTTLQDSLMARLDRLATAKDVAQLGAVLGRAFRYELLRAVSPLADATLQRELERLVEADLLHVQGMTPHATYTFKHAMIQDAAYQSLLKSTRQNYHGRVAEILVAHFSEEVETRPEFVAYHYTAAGATALGIEYWQRAGRRARARSAHVEAIAHFDKGLELLHRLPPSRERTKQELALRIPQAASLVAAKGGGASEVQRAYETVRLLCEEIGDAVQLARALYGLWGFHVNRAQHLTARALAEQLLALAERTADPATLLAAHNALGTTLIFLGEPARARTHLEDSIALGNAHKFQSAGLTALMVPRVANYIYVAWPLWLLGFPDQALHKTRESIALAQELGHPFSLAVAATWAAVLHDLRGEDESVQEYAAMAERLSREQGFATTAAGGMILQGWALARRGVLEEGVQQMTAGLRAWRQAGSELFQYWHLLIARGHALTGHIDKGLTQLDEAFAIVQTSGEVMWQPELYRLKGELLLEAKPSNEREAETCLQEALRISRRQAAKSLELRAATTLGRLWGRSGRRNEARLLLAEVYSEFTEGLDTGDLQEGRTLLRELA